MSRRILCMCAALLATVIPSHPNPALGFQILYDDSEGADDDNFAFHGFQHAYPGEVFGYQPDYLSYRTISATGGFGHLTYGRPQPAMTEELPRSEDLVRAATATDSTSQRVVNGEAAFRKRDYQGAIDAWRAELAARPPNGVLQMMLGQAYFAAGNYRKATVATQAALRALPEDRWYAVLNKREELYSDPEDYTLQLLKLETAVEKKPKDPALRFLLGYHYAGLDYPRPAVAELDKVISLEPRDELAIQFRKALLPRLPARDAPVIIPGEPSPSSGGPSR